jgi:hypothetical protein
MPKAAKRIPATPIGSLIEDMAKLARVLASVRSPQIYSVDVRGHIKAVAEAWFRSYRSAALGQDLSEFDARFQSLHTASERLPSTKKIRGLVKALRTALVTLQTAVVAAPALRPATDPPPSFAAVPNAIMQQVLTRRWNECVTCLAAGAPMAATVMMGGLLESLFLARINRERNQGPIFTANAAPKDSRTSTPKSLREWGLADYIAVAHELGWISQAANDVSDVLRDYRNYIHPQKELSSQAALTPDDARMFWVVAKEMAARLL